jgi:AAA family ATP:ADP antiporter
MERPHPIAVLRALSREERLKASILSGWFFLVITTLWLLKPIRQASLLAHLGSGEIPYVRLGAVVVVAVVVAVYSRVVDRLTRIQVARGASLAFSALLLAFWAALHLGGETLGGQRWFVWAIFIMVDVYSTVMVGIFWTYANDVVSRQEADRLYGPIGLGGIVGGIVGGAIVDVLVRAIGPIELLLSCAALGIVCAGVVTVAERTLRPAPRRPHAEEKSAIAAALEGLRMVARSRYLVLIVAIVVGYEFAAAMTDFVVSVIFEREFTGEEELAQMFGRLGWIAGTTALVSQLLIVPALLPHKRIALMVPPIAMALATVGLAMVPVVGIAILLSATDRGLNYSLQQVTKETLYVPLSDGERYKAKALIDMVVDRGGKALSSLALMAIIAREGVSIPISLAVALIALVIWTVSARALGRAYARKVAETERAVPQVAAAAGGVAAR